ncbi:hypothetical protein GCM10022204_30280 [Microlunatus aurantiacus]|uniref:Uncharacterized protein n=1 Tax=Microlunatus aurantiacus TaxID=446786 RepID=A0ABP7DYW7_9ACTN
MSRPEPEGRASRPISPRGPVRAYLHRFFTSWVAEDPDPTYSRLDRCDGIGQVPDPVTEPAVAVPESVEVAEHVPGGERTPSRSAVGGRAGL